ncbi:inositol transporter 4 [Cyclospora cayetanensis]|uniref:Hexose transporter 1 n=1 Tax=Cyclospora cayetanensis TaxID=88456 RepID=A0A6P6RY41_9EIME|nr:inositol transporter 4 [Cyclospora cayetanensis]
MVDQKSLAEAFSDKTTSSLGGPQPSFSVTVPQDPLRATEKGPSADGELTAEERREKEKEYQAIRSAIAADEPWSPYVPSRFEEYFSRIPLKPKRLRGHCSFILLSVSGFAALTGLLMGYDMCIVAVVLDPVSQDFNLCGSADTCNAKTLFVSVLAPGAMLGSVLGGIVADRYGRRPGLLLSDFCLFLASILFACGFAYWIALTGRFFVGVGVGTGFVVYSTYMSEIAPTDIRGILVACQEVAQCTGCLFAYVLAAIWGGSPWRVMMGGAGIIALLQIVGEVFVLPESPRYLLRHGRGSEARAAAMRLFNFQNKDQLDTFLAVLLRDIAQELEEFVDQRDEVLKTGVKQNSLAYYLYKYKMLVVANARPMFIAVGCAVAQNLTAANSVIYFAIDIFKMAGIEDPYLAGAGVGAMKFMGVICCLCLVERIGRRVLLLIGSFGSMACHLIMGSGFLLKDLRMASLSGMSAADEAAALSGPTTLLVVGMLAFMFLWNISWAALMFVVASEVLPNGSRGIGMGMTITAFWTVAFIMQSTLEPLFMAITIAGTFFLFSGLSALAGMFVYFYVPEGKGVGLEEMVHVSARRSRMTPEERAAVNERTRANAALAAEGAAAGAAGRATARAARAAAAEANTAALHDAEAGSEVHSMIQENDQAQKDWEQSSDTQEEEAKESGLNEQAYSGTPYNAETEEVRVGLQNRRAPDHDISTNTAGL